MGSLKLLIPVVIIIFFIMPVFLKIRLSYNVLNNRGVLVLYIFGLKIRKFDLKLTTSSILLYTEKDVIQKEYKDIARHGLLIKKFLSQIREKVRLKSLEFYYNLGVGDAFDTALFCGYLNAVLLGGLAMLKNAKPTGSYLVVDNPAYNETVFQTSLKIKISISLFDLVYSFINSVILTLREVIL